MTSREQYIEGVKKGKLMRGKKEMLAFLRGERLTQKEAILAHCYDCQGFYSDGAEDCLSDICPLRPFMPYNPNRIKAKTTNHGGNAEGLRKWREAQAVNGGNMDDDSSDELEGELANVGT